MDSQITRDRGDRAFGLSGDPDTAISELERILRSSGHEADSFLQDQVILEMEPPSNPGRFSRSQGIRSPVNPGRFKDIDLPTMADDLTNGERTWTIWDTRE